MAWFSLLSIVRAMKGDGTVVGAQSGDSAAELQGIPAGELADAEAYFRCARLINGVWLSEQ
jgi:hypothetical protein